MQTPWGKADSQQVYADGITFYGTPSHGGFKLSRERNAQVHPALRQRGGWYEEDCEYHIVVYTFPEVFAAEHGSVETAREKAERGVRDWFPEEWEQRVTGVTLFEEEPSGA